MKQKNLFIAVLAVLVLVAAAGTFMYKKQQVGQASQPTAQNLAVLVRADSPTFGNPNAPVHIVEFFDPACGTCRDFYPLVKAMMAANPDKIRLSMRYAPFHPGSDAVVKVLEASRKQGKFEATLEALFASQDSWVKNHRRRVLGTEGQDPRHVIRPAVGFRLSAIFITADHRLIVFPKKPPPLCRFTPTG